MIYVRTTNGTYTTYVRTYFLQINFITNAMADSQQEDHLSKQPELALLQAT